MDSKSDLLIIRSFMVDAIQNREKEIAILLSSDFQAEDLVKNILSTRIEEFKTLSEICSEVAAKFISEPFKYIQSDLSEINRALETFSNTNSYIHYLMKIKLHIIYNAPYMARLYHTIKFYDSLYRSPIIFLTNNI